MKKPKSWSRFFTIVVSVLYSLFIVISLSKPSQPITLKPLTDKKNSYEVFGFAPYWNLDKLNKVDFGVLTTLAYFDVKVDASGSLITNDDGYQGFVSRDATQIFQKAHQSGTRVVLTLTQMDSGSIENIMDNQEAQNNLINQTTDLVKKRGIDGVNVDFEYAGDPGPIYRDQFSHFVGDLTNKLHEEIPTSQVTVSTYASAIKEPKIYDIGALANSSDGIFMMAYDFAVANSDQAIPTAPLYGYKEGKYWYDVSTAVDDFLTQMPSDKLILGVPWYGYDYVVYQPGVKAETRPYYSWKGTPNAKTYAFTQDYIAEDMTGWDNIGKVGWKAYYVPNTDTWRMIFLEDNKSLGLKYDFAKSKNLKGVGVWALGFDDGKRELWQELKDNFGVKLAKDVSLIKKLINENI